MDLKIPIVLTDELLDDIVTADALLDMASGELQKIVYRDYDVAKQGLPWEQSDYQFSCGMLSNNGKEVEFSIEVHTTTGVYSVSATELLEIKMRAAALFSGIPVAAFVEEVAPPIKRKRK